MSESLIAKRPADKIAPYERIREAILNGDLLPGAPLVEASLAEWCAVSRTPVREALSRLEQDGLVQRGDRGLEVRQRSPEEILDIYEIRIALEGMAARIAAERHTNLDRMRLERLQRACEDCTPDDPHEITRRNRAFHLGVVRASHNDALIDVLNRLHSHLARYPALTLAYPGRWSEALDQHRMIVDAIIRRDGDAAAAAAEAHFGRAKQIRIEMWQDEFLS